MVWCQQVKQHLQGQYQWIPCIYHLYCKLERHHDICMQFMLQYYPGQDTGFIPEGLVESWTFLWFIKFFIWLSMQPIPHNHRPLCYFLVVYDINMVVSLVTVICLLVFPSMQVVVRKLYSSPPGQNGCHFGKWHFQMHFLEWKWENSNSNFTETCS